MKKIINIVLLITLVILGTSCENDMDNYDAPNGGIRGTVIDETTKEPIPLPVQGGGGVIVNLYEQNTSATKSVDFRAKQDGTYENSQVFNGEYKVVVNGPFVGKCEGIVNIKGQTQFDLIATPYSRIGLTATVDAANKVSMNYTVSPTDASFVVSEVSVMWNFAPGVDIHSSNYAMREVIANNSQNYLLDLANDSKFKENHFKIQANGNKIYVRVAAKVNDVVNYSKVVELVVK